MYVARMISNRLFRIICPLFLMYTYIAGLIRNSILLEVRLLVFSHFHIPFLSFHCHPNITHNYAKDRCPMFRAFGRSKHINTREPNLFSVVEWKEKTKTMSKPNEFYMVQIYRYYPVWPY